MYKITKNLILKSLVLMIIGIIFVLFVYGINLGNNFYKDIFRLSSDQISDSLTGIKPLCEKLSDCGLLPGDILIRRYMTDRTWLFDRLAHPYYTHTAYYLGDDRLVEATGTEKDPEDEILIVALSKSDWLNSDVDDFVIIRPKNYFLKLEIIKSNLVDIAEDPDYTFGLPKQGFKRATCADLIFQQLFDEGIINTHDVPRIITPDYLFWAVTNDLNDFEIIGYNIQE